MHPIVAEAPARRVSVLICLVFTLLLSSVARAHAPFASSTVPLAVDPFLFEAQAIEKLAKPGRGWTRRLTIIDGRFALERLRGETVTARHVFTGLEPLTWTEDDEFVIVVHKTGDVYAIDQDLLRRAQFRAKVPAFKVGYVRPDGIRAAYFVSEKLWREPRAPYAHDAQYPTDRARDHLWDAGNLIVLREAGARFETAAEFSRRKILRVVAAGEGALAELALALDPEVENERIENLPPWEVARAVLELPKDVLARLTPNAADLIARSHLAYDRFRLDGERDVRSELSVREDARRVLSPRRLNGLALAAGVAGAAAYGLAGTDVASALTPALVDPDYRDLAFKAAASLAVVLPATWLTAAVASRMAGGDGDGSRALLRFGTGVLAKVNTAAWHLAAKAMRQPHLVDAWAYGLDPSRKIEPESPLGRLANLERPARGGWVNPLSGESRRRQELAETEKIVRAMGDRRREARAFATWLARWIVAEEEKLDPATIAIADEEGADATARLEQDPSLRERWREWLYSSLVDRGDEAAAANPQELEAAIVRARNLAADLKARPIPQRLQVEYALARERTPEFMRTFAVLDNEYFATAQPDAQIARESWERAIYGYYWGLFQTMFVAGPRSDASNPSALAAQADALFYANPAFRYDMFDEIRVNVLIDGPMLMRIHQRENAPRDPAYAPREREWLKPDFKSPGAREGARFWFSRLADLREGGYGHLWHARLRQSFAMLQTTLAMTVGSRMFFSGADFSSSVGAYVVFFAVGPWLVGPLTDPVISTNARTKAHFDGNAVRINLALERIVRGVRIGDRAEWEEGARALGEIMQEPGARATDEVREALARDPATWREDDALRWVESARADPPLPGVGPRMISSVANFGTIVYMVWAGNLVSVVTFDPATNWPLLLGGAVVGSAGLYRATHAAQKKIDERPCAESLRAKGPE